MTGTGPDTLSAVRKAREFAAEFQFQNGYPIPVHFLAKKVADENQLYTQAAYKRSLASVMILGWCVPHLPPAAPPPSRVHLTPHSLAPNLPSPVCAPQCGR